MEVQLQQRDDGTSILVSWQILEDPGVTRKRAVNKWEYAVVRYRMVDLETPWMEEIIRNVSQNGTYLVTDLVGNERYGFHFILYDSNGNFGRPFDAGTSKCSLNSNGNFGRLFDAETSKCSLTRFPDRLVFVRSLQQRQ